jgi:hypothetical protein
MPANKAKQGEQAKIVFFIRHLLDGNRREKKIASSKSELRLFARPPGITFL